VSLRREGKKNIKRRITIQSAKSKGRILQQWTCKKIAKTTGYVWGKDKPIESRPMSQSGVDIRLEESVKKLFPFSVECKWQESWAVPAWIEQAKKNQMEGTDWLLVIKRNRKLPVVIMDADSFFRLIKKASNLDEFEKWRT